MSKDLPTLLKRVTEHRPLVVVLDGIDQFASSGDAAAAFNWIPDVLPANVKMILTMRSKDFEGFSHLKVRSLAPFFLAFFHLLLFPTLPPTSLMFSGFLFSTSKEQKMKFLLLKDNANMAVTLVV